MTPFTDIAKIVLASVILLSPLLISPKSSLASTNKNSEEVSNNEEKSTLEAQVKPLLKELKELILEYYPRAKVKETNSSLEAQYKTKKSISVYTKQVELMPKVGGIYCVVRLDDGEYSGRDRLNVEEVHFYYEKLTLAPYIKAFDKHLYAQISYSADSAIEFKKKFKRIVRRLNKGKANTRTSKTVAQNQQPQNNAVSKKISKKSDKLFAWKATKGKEVVYLLGTIHVAKKNFYPLPKGILDAFEKSNHLLVEIDITKPEIVKAMKASRKKANGLYQPPDKLEDKLRPKTKKVFEEFLKWSGESWQMYNRYKPWLAADILSGSIPRRGDILKFSGRYGIDLFLLRQANRNDIPVSSLESTDREFVSQLPESVAETRLLVFLLQMKNTASDIEEIFEVWNAGDLKGMAELDLRQERKYPELREYHKVLLDDRNLKMVSKLLELMPKFQGPHFVAVGSAHMTGETGLVNQLAKQGFTVTQLEKSRPSIEGLVVKDVSKEYKFEEGPCLSWRKQLYNEIQACKAKGVGIQAYMQSFRHLEKCVKNGYSEFQVKQVVRRIEKGLSKQLAPLKPQVITPYCIKLEKLLAKHLSTVSGLTKNCTLSFIVDKDGQVLDLKPSKGNKIPKSINQIAINQVKQIGPFPAPPKAPLRLKLTASKNKRDVEVWYRGVIDYKEFMRDLRGRIKRNWRPRQSTSKILTVAFRVYRNGTVGKIRVKKSSGSQSYDLEAVRAVDQASPFQKLPDGSAKYVNLDYKFHYHVAR